MAMPISIDIDGATRASFSGETDGTTSAQIRAVSVSRTGSQTPNGNSVNTSMRASYQVEADGTTSRQVRIIS